MESKEIPSLAPHFPEEIKTIIGNNPKNERMEKIRVVLETTPNLLTSYLQWSKTHVKLIENNDDLQLLDKTAKSAISRHKPEDLIGIDDAPEKSAALTAAEEQLELLHTGLITAEECASHPEVQKALFDDEALTSILPHLEKLKPDEFGAVFSMTNSNGATPLHHLGVFSACIPYLEALLLKQDGPKVVLKLLSKQNDKGNTPLHEEFSFDYVIPLLVKLGKLENGSNHVKELLSLKGQNSNTPLHYISYGTLKYGGEPALSPLLEVLSSKEITELIENKNDKGETPLCNIEFIKASTSWLKKVDFQKILKLFSSVDENGIRVIDKTSNLLACIPYLKTINDHQLKEFLLLSNHLGISLFHGYLNAPFENTKFPEEEIILKRAFGINFPINSIFRDYWSGKSDDMHVGEATMKWAKSPEATCPEGDSIFYFPCIASDSGCERVAQKFLELSTPEREKLIQMLKPEQLAKLFASTCLTKNIDDHPDALAYFFNRYLQPTLKALKSKEIHTKNRDRLSKKEELFFLQLPWHIPLVFAKTIPFLKKLDLNQIKEILSVTNQNKNIPLSNKDVFIAVWGLLLANFPFDYIVVLLSIRDPNGDTALHNIDVLAAAIPELKKLTPEQNKHLLMLRNKDGLTVGAVALNHKFLTNDALKEISGLEPE